jgi:hypothetical protein
MIAYRWTAEMSNCHTCLLSNWKSDIPTSRYTLWLTRGRQTLIFVA